MPDDELLLRQLIGGDPGAAAQIVHRAENEPSPTLLVAAALVLHPTDGADRHGESVATDGSDRRDRARVPARPGGDDSGAPARGHRVGAPGSGRRPPRRPRSSPVPSTAPAPPCSAVPPRPPAAQWILATALGLAVGLAVGAAAVDYRTSLSALALQGAVCGATVGIGQALILRARLGRVALAWPPVLGLIWALGWAITTAVGVEVDEQFTVFGSSGAVVVTALTVILPSRSAARKEPPHDPSRRLRHRPDRPPRRRAARPARHRRHRRQPQRRRRAAGCHRGRRRRDRPRPDQPCGRRGGRRLLLPQRPALRPLGRGVPAPAAGGPRGCPLRRRPVGRARQPLRLRPDRTARTWSRRSRRDRPRPRPRPAPR